MSLFWFSVAGVPIGIVVGAGTVGLVECYCRHSKDHHHDKKNNTLLVSDAAAAAHDTTANATTATSATMATTPPPPAFLYQQKVTLSSDYCCTPRPLYHWVLAAFLSTLLGLYMPYVVLCHQIVPTPWAPDGSEWWDVLYPYHTECGNFLFSYDYLSLGVTAGLLLGFTSVWLLRVTVSYLLAKLSVKQAPLQLDDGGVIATSGIVVPANGPAAQQLDGTKEDRSVPSGCDDGDDKKHVGNQRILTMSPRKDDSSDV